MKKSTIIVLAIISGSIILSSLAIGLWFGLNPKKLGEIHYPVYTASQMEEFLLMPADLSDTSSNDDLLSMIATSQDWIDNSDPYYTNITYHLQKPNVKFWSVDYFGRKSESYYWYWLPPNWNSLPIKKALLYSHGHCAIEPKRLGPLQLFARNYSMAIFCPQIWIATEDIPDGYAEFVRDEEHISLGIPRGYHLGPKDVHLFMNAIKDEYAINSFYLEGFSYSGAVVMILAAFDHLSNNITDFITVDGGSVTLDDPVVAPFLQEMKDLGHKGEFYQGESFFLFTELEPSETEASKDAGDPTDDIIINNGANMTMEVYIQAGHGELVFNTGLWPYLKKSLEIYMIKMLERLS